MIIMGGFMKGKAVFFAVLGIIFIVAGIVMGGFVRSTFIIIGVADLAAAGFSYWMAKSTENQQQQMMGGMPQQGQVPGQGPGSGGNWVS
jgi:hypothetical protein